MNDLLDLLHELQIDLLIEGLDLDYSIEERKSIQQEAKKLRKRMVELRRKQFDDNTVGYKEAVEELKEINESLRLAKERIDNLIGFLGNMARLAAALDKLIEAAMPA